VPKGPWTAAVWRRRGLVRSASFQGGIEPPQSTLSF